MFQALHGKHLFFEIQYYCVFSICSVEFRISLLFVCFILRFEFPLCPRPQGPIGTPLAAIRTIEGCLLLGVSSQPYVVFMGIDPWAHQSEHWQFARLYNFILRMCGIAQSYNWSVTPLEISDIAEVVRRRTVPEIPREMQQLRTISRLILNLEWTRRCYFPKLMQFHGNFIDGAAGNNPKA